MIPAANTTNVRPRLSGQDKVLYEGQLNQLEGVVSNDHLFDVYLGECIAPYVALEPLKTALPVHRSTMTMPLLPDGGLDVAALHPTMQRRWNNAAAMFRQAHQGRGITELFANLNHLNKLTSHLDYLQGAIAGDGTIRIVYTTSGEPTATAVADNSAIVESNLYQTMCASTEEARYLLATINSNDFAARVKPFCPTNWAKKIRHIHKHGWKLPIPRYDASDPLHVRLSELGAAAEQECQAIIAESDILSQPAGDAQSRATRRLLRHEWQPNSTTAQAIEKAVAKLLSDPAQAALAESQMQTAQSSTVSRA